MIRIFWLLVSYLAAAIVILAFRDSRASPPSKSFNQSSLLTSRRGCHARRTSPSVPAGGFFKPSAASHY